MERRVRSHRFRLQLPYIDSNGLKVKGQWRDFNEVVEYGFPTSKEGPRLAALKTLVGWFALLFHFLFCLLLVALGGLAIASGPQVLRIDMLPWTGAELADILLFGGFFGLASIVLAALGRLRFLFVFWSLAVAIVLGKQLVFSTYRFPPGEWRPALYLVLATWFAVLGAIFLIRSKPGPGPRKYRVK
jgi:hypothetical protein